MERKPFSMNVCVKCKMQILMVLLFGVKLKVRHLYLSSCHAVRFLHQKLSEYFHLRKFPSIEVMLSYMYITESQSAL